MSEYYDLIYSGKAPHIRYNISLNCDLEARQSMKSGLISEYGGDTEKTLAGLVDIWGWRTKTRKTVERCYLRQVHGDRVVLAGELDGSDPLEADAVVLFSPGDIACIRVADCVPVIVWCSDSKCIGLAHAGFKGLINGVLAALINRMAKEFSIQPCNMRAVIGPNICPDCYDRHLKGDLSTRIALDTGLVKLYRKRDDRYWFDLSGSAREQLIECGFSETQIEIIPLCTKCGNDLLFSHRNGDGALRQYLIARVIDDM